MVQLWRTSLFGTYDKLCSHSPTATRDLTRSSAQLTIASEEKRHIVSCTTHHLQHLSPAHDQLPQISPISHALSYPLTSRSAGQAFEFACKVTSAFHPKNPSRKSRAPFHRTAAAMQFVFTFIHPSYTPTAQSPSSSIVIVLRYKFCTVPTV
jgi:hypothetical protein